MEFCANRRGLEYFKQYFDMGIRYNRSLIIGEKWQLLQTMAGLLQTTQL